MGTDEQAPVIGNALVVVGQKPDAAVQAVEPKDQARPAAPDVQAPKRYFVVNPKGTIHEVSRAHAIWRLKDFVGYRMATPAEVQALMKAKGHQVFDRPLGKPFEPEKAVELDL